jgi:hypothetical protein
VPLLCQSVFMFMCVCVHYRCLSTTVAWAVAVAFFERSEFANASEWLEKCAFLTEAMDSHVVMAQSYRAISLGFFMAKQYQLSDTYV